MVFKKIIIASSPLLHFQKDYLQIGKMVSIRTHDIHAIDFSKAFYYIQHHILLHLLSQIGCCMKYID